MPLLPSSGFAVLGTVGDWIGNSIGVGRVYGVIADQARTDRRAAACPPPRARASRAVRTAVTVGGRCRRRPLGRAGGTAAHATAPRVVAGRRVSTPIEIAHFLE
jgi:hypothetical protein